MAATGDPQIRPVRGWREFELALEIRRAVFVQEQGGPPEDEPDAWDSCARHWLVLAGERPAGTARVYQPRRGLAKLGRIALLPEFRGRGWGALLMRALEQYAGSLGVTELALDAQVCAVPFYERLGYVPEGEEFLEAGIPHRRMVKRLRTRTAPPI
ncbi:MAG: GNAT family N-acetyltransferase [Armatimonadota bacterium]